MKQRTNEITIIGAGMAGLLAGNMLRRHQITILEKKQFLPENHTAVLRFRSTAVSDATGIPFDKVKVDKAFWDGERICSSVSLAQANLYSYRVTNGHIHSRSIKNLESEIRYIAPNDFVAQMAKNLQIKFGESCDRPRQDHPVISTMPMPVMMNMIGWEEMPDFAFEPIWTVRCKVIKPHCHVYQTIYSVCDDSWYRATLQKDLLILEFTADPSHLGLGNVCQEALEIIIGHGINGNHVHIETENPTINHQPFGKIASIDEGLRRRFILHLTDKWNIYSLGRFATWRSLLLDNLVDDIKHIEKMITNGCNYERRLTTY
jgi:hypothetical protein